MSIICRVYEPILKLSFRYDSFPVDVTNFIGGVNKTYAFAAAFDEHAGLWAALRVLVEWARNVNLVKSGKSEGKMTVVSFCHLFIYHATSSPPVVHAPQKPYTLARFDSWITSMRDSSCGQLVFDFLKHISIRKNKEWIASKTDPHNNEPLIKPDFIGDLRQNAEIALYVLSVHEGDVQKLFQYSSKKRLFRIDKRYLNPLTVGDRERRSCFKEIQAKCNPKKNCNLKFDLLERNGVYYLEVIGDHNYFKDVERGLNKINSRMQCAHFNKWRTKAFHVVNATMIIPEFGSGLQTVVTFALYDSEKFMPQHTGKLKSVLKVRATQKNHDWRSDEYKRYEKHFLGQIALFKGKQQRLKKKSQHSRFFGAMECTIRCGYHYLFNIPETLHNSFETNTLKEVQRNISQHEEAFEKENEASIIQDEKNYNKLTLFQMPTNAPSQNNAPLPLMPLNTFKNESRKRKTVAVDCAPTKNKTGGMRHSFYPDWTLGEDKCREFAFQNGFKEDAINDYDYYSNISLVWRQRELVASCDRNGILTEIRHRPSRWISSTIKRNNEQGGPDVRAYLKTRAPLDDDETCLDTVVDYLNGRSIFRPDYASQIKHNSDRSKIPIPFTPIPLVSEMFQLNWKFNSMRLITPILKFKNGQGDVLLLHQVHDGIFRLDTKEFEWFPAHQEFEARLSMKRDDHDLCKKSFEMSLKLFDLTAKRVDY